MHAKRRAPENASTQPARAKRQELKKVMRACEVCGNLMWSPIRDGDRIKCENCGAYQSKTK
jgi:hypothetical protein